MKLRNVVFASLTVTLAAACGGSSASKPPPAIVSAPASADVLGIAAEAGTFTTLLALIDEAGLTDTLKSDGSFTVFAPTDEAFAKLPAGALDALKADPARLKAVLTYHVLKGEELSGAEAARVMAWETVEGDKLAFTSDTDADQTLVVNGSSRVLQADISASNGVIHVIDTVLLPPEATGTPDGVPADPVTAS